MFGKEKKRLMVVKVDCSHCKSIEEKDKYLQSVENMVIEKLKFLKYEKMYDVLVVSQAIDIKVVE